MADGGNADGEAARAAGGPIGRTARAVAGCPAVAALFALAWLGASAMAQPGSGPVPGSNGPQIRPDTAATCPGLIAHHPAPPRLPLHRASLKSDEVRITFVGHATFLIESPGNVRIATDYNDYVRPRAIPDIATMNRAHSTHYTNNPDPGIVHVLRGWGAGPEEPARHDLSHGDVRVRNVPTNIRRFGSETERHGNSIFVFEMANLCIGHLGHLHHTLTPQQIDEIGRLDVVLVPVDGGYTLDLDGMMEVLQSLKAPLMIPMHFFSGQSLRRFLDRAGTSDFQVEFADAPQTLVSAGTLPRRPTIRVLPGR